MIKLSNLHYSYGDKEILKGLDLEIAKGRFCAVMGANGCGKSTLLKCIAGLNTAKGGRISLDGKDLAAYSTRELAQQLSLVQQQSHTDMEFSAFEIVLMGRNPYQKRLQNESEQDWKIVEECMKMTNTWGLRFSKPHEMSGGELQRVMIARALAQKTPVMLLDEPTSNLDIAHQMEIMQLLCDINANERKTILIVVHDMNLAYHYCQELLLLKSGKALYYGPMEEGLTPERIKEVFGVEAEIYQKNIFFRK
ncbi:MAG: ABC transporter ATP-binding protein [Bacteroidales bacterium]|nr:ABC transporter ATP-binding protein [Bacteroidales bacterium]